MKDTLDSRRAEGIVHALTEQETATCSDCGKSIDVSEAYHHLDELTEAHSSRGPRKKGGRQGKLGESA